MDMNCPCVFQDSVSRTAWYLGGLLGARALQAETSGRVSPMSSSPSMTTANDSEWRGWEDPLLLGWGKVSTPSPFPTKICLVPCPPFVLSLSLSFCSHCGTITISHGLGHIPWTECWNPGMASAGRSCIGGCGPLSPHCTCCQMPPLPQTPSQLPASSTSQDRKRAPLAAG